MQNLVAMSSAEAELYAIEIVLAMCPTPPHIVTDCKSVLTAANSPPHRLTAPHAPHLLTAISGTRSRVVMVRASC